jgi:tRNA(His) 5'-end guanylyltransferase
VVDYFRWRQEDAVRNALSAQVYWLLRRDGLAPREASASIEGSSSEEKLALLAARGIDFAATPAWQRLGTGVRWQAVRVEGVDPRTGITACAERKRLYFDEALPRGEAYGAYLRELQEYDAEA